MQKETQDIQFVQGVNADFNDSLENKRIKSLLFFDDSRQKNCDSRDFLKNAAVGRHRGLGTINIKRNLFHRSKLRRDIELHSAPSFFSNHQEIFYKLASSVFI